MKLLLLLLVPWLSFADIQGTDNESRPWVSDTAAVMDAFAPTFNGAMWYANDLDNMYYFVNPNWRQIVDGDRDGNVTVNSLSVTGTDRYSKPCPVLTAAERDIIDASPFPPTVGDCHYNSDDLTEYVWNGTAWASLSGMKWLSTWVNTNYVKDDVVRDGSWTMVCVEPICNERAGPVPNGDAAYTYPDIPAWATNNQLATVHSGAQYDFTTSGWVRRVRVWVPTVNANTTYRLLLGNNTSAPTQWAAQLVIFPAAGIWEIVLQQSILVASGQSYIALLETIDSAANTTFQDGWNYQAQGNNLIPTTTNYVVSQTNDNVRVHEQSLGANYSVQLYTVVIGSEIQVVDTVDANRSVTYQVNTNPIDQGVYAEWGVVEIDVGPAGRPPIGNATTIIYTVPTPSAADYVELAGHWATQPAYATVTPVLLYDGVVQAVTDQGFGLDMEVETATFSTQWELVALSDISAGEVGVGADHVVGPVSSIDNHIAQFDGVTGKLVKETLYSIPNADGTAGQGLVTDGLGVATWQSIPTVVPPTLLNSPVLWDDALGTVIKTTDYAFPPADGTANYFLQTDGAGTVTWVAPPSGGPTPSLENGLAFYDDTLGNFDTDDGTGVAWSINPLENFRLEADSTATPIGEPDLVITGVDALAEIGNTAITSSGADAMMSHIDNDQIATRYGVKMTSLGDLLLNQSQGGSAIRFMDDNAEVGNWSAAGLSIGATPNEYLLPNVDGLNTQVLSTDGVGVVSWVNPGASVGAGYLMEATVDITCPALGSVRRDNATPAATGIITISQANFTGLNVGAIYDRVLAGDYIFFAGDDVTNEQYLVTADPVFLAPNCYTIAVSLDNSIGAIAAGTVSPVHITYSGAGHVVGPASSVDRVIPIFDGITGKIIQESNPPASIDAFGNIYTSSTNSLSNGVIGNLNATQWFGIMNRNLFTPDTNNGNYMIMQNQNGFTLINSIGTDLTIRKNGATVMKAPPTLPSLDGQVLTANGTTGNTEWTTPVSVSGNDNELVRIDGTTGLQNSLATLDDAGNITAVGYFYSSDKRLKTSMVRLENTLDNLTNINGYMHGWKDKPGITVGLSAQEVEEVYPQLVKTHKGYKAVDYPRMVPILLEAIKELKAEVELLKQRL